MESSGEDKDSTAKAVLSIYLPTYLAIYALYTSALLSCILK